MNEAAPVSLKQIAELSIRELVDLRADLTPDAVFIVAPDTGEEVTCSALRDSCIAVASQIAAKGIAPGETVAYAMVNGPVSAVTILGIFYGGYIATAVNLVAGNDTISYVLSHSRTRLVLAQAETRGLIGKAAQTVEAPPEILAVDASFFNANADAASLPAASHESDGLLMYTSGTTGRPKGVVLRQSSLIAGGVNAAHAHKLSPPDRAMCVLPLYHINGLCVTIMGPLVSGGSVVIPPKFSVSTFWGTIRDHGCSWFSVVPTQISYLLHNAEQKPDAHKHIASLRFGRSASAPLSPDVHEAFEAKFGLPIIETMGLTETAAQILSNPLPPGQRKIGSPGVAIGNEILIGDDQQREVARGVEGEVLVRGPNVMRVYLYNEEATTASLTPDGWLRTGDLGRMDEDGYVFITGRLKELIIKGGENIAPREVDEALYAHPDIIEAAAFACACERYGQRIEAGVAISPDSSVSEADLIELCKSKIGPFKAPDRIHFMAELPKGPSGKIQRRKLQEMFAGQGQDLI
jgi:acyl-CoA synthetase (AMP-forming)/AMP-acid ligase II